MYYCNEFQNDQDTSWRRLSLTQRSTWFIAKYKVSNYSTVKYIIWFIIRFIVYIVDSLDMDGRVYKMLDMVGIIDLMIWFSFVDTIKLLDIVDHCYG